MDSLFNPKISAIVDTSIFFYSKGELLDESDYDEIVRIYIEILERRWLSVQD
jgi:hypothetical protein